MTALIWSPAAVQEVAAQVAVGLAVADHGLDGGAAPEFASDPIKDAALRAAVSVASDPPMEGLRRITKSPKKESKPLRNRKKTTQGQAISCNSKSYLAPKKQALETSLAFLTVNSLRENKPFTPNM